MIKQLSWITCFLFSISLTLQAQIPEFIIFNQHTSYSYPSNTTMFVEEYSHWTPFEVSFWSDENYNMGANYQQDRLSIYNPNKSMWLNDCELRFVDPFGDRIKLDYDGLQFINGASWQAIKLFLRGAEGQLQLDNGSGFINALLGSTGMNTGIGSLILNNFGLQRVSISGHGRGFIFGPNSTNVYFGDITGGVDRGYVAVVDDAGNFDAGLYIDGSGNGIVFGHTKNFRIPHPQKSNQEIWYASLEGPEAAAYERGTAQLVNGEAFVFLSDHFQIVGNQQTMTVQITPNEWDTYGLAVVEKTDNGFFVKELKGGKGNFSFDWEAKCVRAGEEKYQVIRSSEEFQALQPVGFNQKKIGLSPEKVASPVSKDFMKKHQHSQFCVHSRN